MSADESMQPTQLGIPQGHSPPVWTLQIQTVRMMTEPIREMTRFGGQQGPEGIESVPAAWPVRLADDSVWVAMMG